MRTISDMVQQEVMCCMSSMVSNLAEGHGALVNQNTYTGAGDAALELIEQAFELACPIADYEEAAIQAGWKRGKTGIFTQEGSKACWPLPSWEALCDAEEIEPYDREVFEHWAVTRWFAEKLMAHGEKVDTDFAGLNVWARTTTGQAIESDGVIERIYQDMMKA